MTPNTPQGDCCVTEAMQKLIDDFAFEAGKSAIGALQGVDSRNPEGIILKQGFNRAQAALEIAIAQSRPPISMDAAVTAPIARHCQDCHFETTRVDRESCPHSGGHVMLDGPRATPRNSTTAEYASPLSVALVAEKRPFPQRILSLLREVADRKGTATRGPWEDENGEPMQNDADAAIAWIEAQTKQADSGDLAPSASGGK